jgi:DEAD/DEAH box helicase domain-containing protein
VEAERAFTTVHPGAVYLHLGRSYEVRELDLEARRAVVDEFDGDWYTQPKSETEVYIERIVAKSDDPLAGGLSGGGGAAAVDLELFFGEVSVTQQVIGFQRKRLSDHEVIDVVAVDLPESNFPTQGLWYVLGEEPTGPAALPPEILLGALHATEHGQIAVLPLLAMCDRWDIGGLSTNVHFQTGRPTIFIYDGHPGGVGIARRGFDEFARLVAGAAELIGECPCSDGCPSCVQSPKCGNLNEPLHKQGALELMTGMLAGAGKALEKGPG